MSSYEPLHHKYRPQTFADLVGQEVIATTLTNAIARERIAPAYLFTGPRGTGKTSSARILAKSLNCLTFEQPSATPCGKCEVCRAIARGTALDVMEIDAASNTGVDNIREIIERAQFAPVQCRYKVYVIDECHMLSVAAFNALLKILEEPPARVVFILATTDPQRVLPTIISRCQRFDYRRIPLVAMADHLSKIAYQEEIDITPEAITLVAQIANGGLRDAESLLDQLSLLVGTVTPEKVWELVGAVSERELLALLEAIAADNPETLLDCSRNLMNRGREPLAILQNLAGFYLNLLIAKTAPNRSDLAALTSSTWQQLQSQASQWELNTLLQGQQHLKDSEAQLKNTTQPRLWLEVTLLGLLPSACGSSQLPKRSLAPVQRETTAIPAVSASVPPPTKLDASQPVVAQTSLPSSQPEPETTSVSSPVVQVGSVDLSQIWQSVLVHLQPFTQALVRPHCYLISLEQAAARVSVRNEPLLRHAQGKIAEIETALEAVCQRRVKVSLQVVSPPPELVEASPTQTVKPAVTIEAPSPPVASPSPPHANKNNDISISVDSELNPPPAKVEPLLPVPPSLVSVETASDLTETEVKKAADSLAKVFDGEIVILNDKQEAEEVQVRTQVMPLEQEAAMTSQPESSSSWEVSDSSSEPSVIRGRPTVADLSQEEDIPF